MDAVNVLTDALEWNLYDKWKLQPVNVYKQRYV